MTHGFNKGLAATSGHIWSYNSKNPQDQGDVKSILFSSEMTDMVRKGEYGLPFACLWIWVYYLAMESCKSTWVADAVDDYIQSSEFNIVLGTQVEGDKVVTLHLFHRIALKSATNSFQTVIRKLQTEHWGVRLKTNALIETKSEKNHVVNIGRYLPDHVKAQMHRKDANRFLLEFVDNDKLANATLLNSKVNDLVTWAQ